MNSRAPESAFDLARRPFVLIWELTQACELACKHCRADAKPDRHPGELTTREGKALLDEIRRFGDNQLVVLSGGDPLYREDTLELIRYGIATGLHVTVTPSGTRSLTPKAVQRLAELGVRRIALSLDGGTPRSHDEFRQEAGSFAQTIRAAKTANEVGLPLQINTTVCEETVDELPTILECIDDLDVALWSVFFLVPVGRGQALESISPDRSEELMTWLLEVRKTHEIAIKTTEAPHYRRVAIQEGDSSVAPSPTVSDTLGRRTGIGAGNGFAFISHTGEVFPSGFLPQSAGNVKSDSIVDIYRHSSLFERLRDRDGLHGKCSACEFNRVCGGSRSRAWATSGDMLGSDPLCPYIPSGYSGEFP